MNNLKYFLTTYVLIIIIVLIIFLLFLPDRSVLYNITELIIILPLISYILLPKILVGKYNKWKDINLGYIFFIAMGIIMIAGNLNYFIVKFIYSSYGENISLTNYYWLGGMVTYALGFLTIKRGLKYNKKDKYLNYNRLKPIQIVIIFSMSLFATLYSFLSLGFIPFLSGAGTGLRYTGSVAGSSIIIRLWCLLSRL